MITFQKIWYRNFKSTGNSPVEIVFDAAKTTLVTGKNGAGKSTITSAICFALFGQDFVLTKGGLVNSINQKQLEVIVDFSIDGKVYRVHRGIKPNLFKIYEDGVLLNEEASVRDYQTLLETQILKMNFRSFRQVIIIGGRSYVPFMKLDSKDRRGFIEDLLDIKIFSIMSSFMKDDVKALKDDLKDIEDESKSLAEKVQMQKAFIAKLADEKSISVSKIEESIKVYSEANLQLVRDVEIKNGELDALIIDSALYKDVDSTLTDLVNEKKRLDVVVKKLTSTVEFFDDVLVCPTCSQTIDSSHKDDVIRESTNLISLRNSDIEKSSIEIERLISLRKKRIAVDDAIADIKSSISDLKTRIKSNIILIDEATKRLDSIKADQTSIDAERDTLTSFAKEYITKANTKKELLETYEYYVVLSQIFSDSGIKTKIIKQYIPTINKLINKYLDSLDFFVKFELDENFNETIKSRHRDTFKYDNFSDGQASRIDLALMFAWRDIAKMRNAVNTNIMFFDEADAAIDAEGSTLLIELLNSVEKSNVFLISHKGDQLVDKVDRVLKFELSNNFTIVEES